MLVPFAKQQPSSREDTNDEQRELDELRAPATRKRGNRIALEH